MKTRNILIISLLIIFGFVLGFFTAGRMARKKIRNICEMVNQPDQEKNQLTKRLHLTDAQLEKLQPIFDSMLPPIHTLRTKHKIELDSARKTMFEAIRPQLTEVQLKKMERMQQKPSFRTGKKNRRQPK